MKQNIIKFYKQNGWVVVRNFFNKKYIKKIKIELLKNSRKKNNNFYYENIKKNLN